MSVLQRVDKRTTRKGKSILLRREPQVIEGPKRTLFLQGRKSSNKLRNVLNDLYILKKPDAQMLTRKNDITVFENPAPIEALCRKHQTSLFVLASHSKKRPDNVVIGRLFNGSILDMIELCVSSFKGLSEFYGPKVLWGCKPCLSFNGPSWELNDELKRLKSLLLDFFHREDLDSIRLQGLEHSIALTATSDGRIILRSYRVMFKKSGTNIPRVELREIGPRLGFTLRRSKLASEDLMTEACKQPTELIKVTKKKNISKDGLGNVHGRVHLGVQDINSLQTRKMKGLKKTVQISIKRKATFASSDEEPKRQKTG